MQLPVEVQAFDRGTEAFFKLLTAEQIEAIVTFKGDAQLQAHIENLATRNTEGELTPEEFAEYEGYVMANSFVATVQAKARRLRKTP